MQSMHPGNEPGEKMKRIQQGKWFTDIIYLVLVMATSAFFILNLRSSNTETSHETGRVRKVNMEKLQQRIQSKSLSDHKALFYKVVP